jgi:hypothetical protein
MEVVQIQEDAMQEVVAALAAELAALRAKVAEYYHEELVLRGDKIMMREYKEWFDMD